jgi:hypothetical protein
MCLRKLIGLEESDNFFDGLRRIKSRMHLPETMGAGGVRFEFDTDGHLDIFLIPLRRSEARGTRRPLQKLRSPLRNIDGSHPQRFAPVLRQTDR